MIRPAIQREVTIDLPDILVESLGVGAEMLAHYLTQLADSGLSDPKNHPPPLPVLCRICERQITPWWFPKHTELCLQEYRAEADLQQAQDNLTEHRNAIVKVLDALVAQSQSQQRKTSNPGDDLPAPTAKAEYKGYPIGSTSGPSSATSSGRSSPASPPQSRTRDSGVGLSHRRARSFAVRRPAFRIVELVLDLCDTALEISTPALKESRDQQSGEFRTQSPQSEGRIAQILQWQSPNAGSYDNEPGILSLCDDTAQLARSKVDSILRFRRIIEYAERIRNEFTALVQDCITAALEKAAAIAAGEISSGSSDESPDRLDLESPEDPPVKVLHQNLMFAFDGPSGTSSAMARCTSPSPTSSPSRRPSTALSTRSSSPKGCATPRSAAGNRNTSYSIGSSAILDNDTGGESDSSMRSSIRSHVQRTASPVADLHFSRVATSRERKRTSLVLHRVVSTSRQTSPSRSAAQPVSPLSVTKPRLPSFAVDSSRSPMLSPTLSGNEFVSPSLPAQQVRHHRRQSSEASSELSRAALSPRISTAGVPQPRALPPSIKDFELIKPISKGAFGSVYLAKKKTTGDYFAIKALKKADMVAKNQVANVKAERAILMWQGESDFVAKLYWTFPSKDYIFLVMEYLNGGDCASLVHALGTLPEDWAKRYLAEVVLGVEHLHSREIVHRDLKPDNLLIDQKGHLKLTDFGLSRMGLIGRQKRALSGRNQTQAPDPLKQSHVHRSVSMASSRSASFDFQGVSSPGLTPTLTPVLPGDAFQPSYFSLSREASGSREPSRHLSRSRTDSPDSHELQAAFRKFSLYDDTWKDRSFPRDDLMEQDEDFTLTTIPSITGEMTRLKTPPQQTAMLPPPMTLFDPEDNNRKFVGTPDYLAPETIRGLGQDEMSDWWSLGCILFEFLFGYPPYHSSTPEKVFENILNRKIDWLEDDTDVSPEAKDLMNKLMCLDPEERLGSNKHDRYISGGEEIRSHPFFSSINWDTLNETEASFIPAPENPEDTEYFDARGATAQDLATEFEDQGSSPASTPGPDLAERPHDALLRVRNQVNSMKRGLMPLHIPAHVRDGRNRRLSEPVLDDFGQFSFKNLPMLEKANNDVIQKLRSEAMQAQARSNQSPKSSAASGSPPSAAFDGTAAMLIPGRRALSTEKTAPRSASPSVLSTASSSSPGRMPPTSPLVQFSAGGHHHHHTRRETSGGHSAMTHSFSSQQPSGFFDMPRLSGHTLKAGSVAGSPIKFGRPQTAMLEKLTTTQSQGSPGKSIGSPRSRSHTVGSNDGGMTKDRLPGHHKQKSQVMDLSPSSSDNDDPRQRALLRVQRRRQSSRRLSQISMNDGPIFRPLDVLVCEDHPVSRLVMEKLLEKMRCRTIMVQDGAEAMRYAMSSVKFDIIMMESQLPKINGADVARMLRDTKNANNHTPIVAVTGYLKELQAPHHFDALVEKPPTVAKLIDVMSRLCQWRPPPPGWNSAHVPPYPRSSLRKESSQTEDSPTSTASSSLPMHSPSCRGSSRQDSVSSASFFTDHEIRSEGATCEDRRHANLAQSGRADGPRKLPTLVQSDSAPATMDAESGERRGGFDTGEAGDDEDDEFPRSRPRSRSPKHQSYVCVSATAAPASAATTMTTLPAAVASKLATEMRRSDSHDTVVLADALSGRPPLETPSVARQAPRGHEHEQAQHGTITPPEIFPRLPGVQIADIVDMGATPTPGCDDEEDPEPTPRASQFPLHIVESPPLP